tara:strand:- start:303 stop:524 length:222 start_codon:yes stop_codon:yes gene_type:complete
MKRLKRIEAARNYYKSNFTPEEQQMHVNFTVDAVKELLTDFENSFVTNDDKDLFNLAMIEDFQNFLENIKLKK